MILHPLLRGTVETVGNDNFTDGLSGLLNAGPIDVRPMLYHYTTM